jgi:signal transduction histidine kinase/ActR/RegA family two-component response regulator
MGSKITSSAPPRTGRAHGLRQWWLDRRLRTKGVIVVALPLAALMALTAANLLLLRAEGQERTESTNARNLEDAANQFLISMVNAETGVGGYLATRDRLFLEPYDHALTQLGAERRSLRAAAVTEGAGRQQAAVDATTDRVLSELAQLRSAAGHGVSAGSLDSALVHEKATMDLLRGQIASLADAPTDLVAVDHNRITALQARIELLDITGLAVGLLGGMIGVALFTSGIVRRVATNAENARLLGEGKRLHPIVYTRDEIGRVAELLLAAAGLLASREAELVAARDAAVRATRAKTAFLSSTSHELRTPLNSILGFAQLLQMSELSGEDRAGVERILGAGHHLLALINELIDIARIESNDLSLSVEPVAVCPVIEECGQLMAPIAAERSVRITQDCAYPALAVYADRQRLSQVLVNLVSNAVKYNRRGGSVTVCCREEGTGQVSVVVSDTGPGILPEDLERIFVPFERLGAERTAVEGTGIGLSLARALTEAMHGQLTAASVPGQGAAFTVRLPRAPDPVHGPAGSLAPAAPAARPHAEAGAGLSVLYIEDNPANTELISRYLHDRPDTTLLSVTSGRAGLDCAVRDVPDVILLDLHLPDLPGEQVLRELKVEPATAAIPVIVLSADASGNVIHRALDHGVLAYLTKPIQLAELGELLDTCAAKARHQQARPADRITPA